MTKPSTPGAAGLATTTLALPRRDFVRYAGAGLALTGLLISGCDDDSENNNDTVDVGSGDPGVLNYAYALEQLEAAFYTQVVAGAFFTGTATAAEKAILQDIRDHEVAHRDLFRQALGNGRIKDLQPDFSTINFADRASVLGAARTFEDLGVHAYNGAGRFISDANNLTLAGKIVSVEARHAALIRELILGANKFVDSDVVDLSTGLERSKPPTEVVVEANKFLQNGSKISANSLR
ncbi:ferritin-like domain-containing protein [Hymenobacter gummosus]|uniref:Ferritin-like domain-containing protein n=1 Tax=Hymenobacter gummosus TaxID=1776032 RepID=A0A431U9R2_9BACT|nr:ferritin-like domain-containing protein [Hymenobacter gummosus]RTQ53566.1 ferritin-like domain-containing protein [Hymenobacter gummosus]